MQKISFFLNFLIIALITTIVGAFFYLKSRPVVGGDSPKISSQEINKKLDESVNKHLQKTMQSIQKTKIMTDKSLNEIQKKLAETKRLNRIKEEKENANIGLERQIWRPEKSQEAEATPIETSDENWQNKMDANEKKEYARQWIENARKEGYLLELSPDLEVIKYLPIRKPSQQDDSIEVYPSD